ncbi:uncharacterized protein LOC112589441 [Harpegnathos saltator]|uniref:uncharacterized protein LOC112589441 n=1 Tax=Harpegnathos saltator TaxID=610380 RepID=UPI000DBEE4F1|nr:uncharacterized protein LOC112589441 [Harpegnathos saltator]
MLETSIKFGDSKEALQSQNATPTAATFSVLLALKSASDRHRIHSTNTPARNVSRSSIVVNLRPPSVYSSMIGGRRRSMIGGRQLSLSNTSVVLARRVFLRDRVITSHYVSSRGATQVGRRGVRYRAYYTRVSVDVFCDGEQPGC